LMVGGFFEFLHWFYHGTLNDLYGCNNSEHQYSHKGFASHFINAEDSRPLSTQLKHELTWNKTVNVTRALTSLPFSINFLAQSLMNRAAFKYDSVFDDGFYISGAIVSTAYYLHELYAAYNQKEIRQGDVPSMGAISGWFKIVSARQILAFSPIGS